MAPEWIEILFGCLFYIFLINPMEKEIAGNIHCVVERNFLNY